MATWAQVRNRSIRLIVTADVQPIGEGWYDITALNPQPQMGYIWNGTEFVAPPATPRIITSLEFYRRFTLTERRGMHGSTNTVVKELVFQVTITPTINLDDPEIVGILTWLESNGLLAAGRAAQILT